jgi:putative endonuclease
MFFYTYVLMCSDGKMYIGSSSNLRHRLEEHRSGYVTATKYRQPVHLIYYEACPSLGKAQHRERYFKTGYGRKFLKQRIEIVPL